MKLPVNLEVQGQWILMVGGGPGALGKLGALVDGLTQQDPPAEPLLIRLVAPHIHQDLVALMNRQDLAPWVQWDRVHRPVRRGDLKRGGRFPCLVYSFTGDSRVEARVAQWCRHRGLWVNAAGQSGGFTSPVQRVEVSGDSKVLVTQGSLSGPARTRGHNPQAARNFSSQRGDIRGSFMPFMMDLNRVVVFAGDRGEGLQKVEKLALFARQVILVPEQRPQLDHLSFGPGPTVHVEEDLVFDREVQVIIWPRTTAEVLERLDQETDLWKDVNYVCSDMEDLGHNQRLHAWAQARGLRHTVIDNKELSDVWFMSLLHQGPLLAALSTQGTCAFYAKQLRLELEAQWPQRSRMAQTLGTLRQQIPPALRKQGLGKIYEDGEFRSFMAQGRESEAVLRAEGLIENFAKELG